MKLLRVFVVASLLAAGFAFLPALPDASADCLSASGSDEQFVGFGPFSMPAGSSITVTLTADGEARLAAAIGSVGGGPTDFVMGSDPSLTHTFTFDSAASDIALLLVLDTADPGTHTAYTVTSTDCGVTLQVIPPQAVSGTFVETAETYWAPGELVQPQTFIEAGKSYLVAGQDETGMYRKVLVACTWVWVRAETVGPNYDAVWNGTPLPTDVVEAGDNNACMISSSPVVSKVEVIVAD